VGEDSGSHFGVGPRALATDRWRIHVVSGTLAISRKSPAVILLESNPA
jgi:hypothetical protein